MDGLALLCNLFADGPVTLRRLRAARVESLDELERAQPERLAEWLHASVPQAHAFAEEARKLGRRLGRERAAQREKLASAAPVFEARVPRYGSEVARPIEPALPPAMLALRPGLVEGLDELVCERLQAQGVRTIQALCECAGLALARRTGIPYSTLLELARRARRMSARGPEPLPASAAELPELREVELVPRARPRTTVRPEPSPEPARSDEFTLPVVEPESAGPFG